MHSISFDPRRFLGCFVAENNARRSDGIFDPRCQVWIVNEKGGRELADSEVWQTAALEIPSRSILRVFRIEFRSEQRTREACGGGRVPMDLISNRADGLEEG